MLKLITLFVAVLTATNMVINYEDILMHNQYFLNQSNEHTFITRNVVEAIDITACNTNCISYIEDWKGSNEITLFTVILYFQLQN